MEHTLVNTAKPIGKSVTTGTTLLQSFHATSGFNYQIGMRKASGLTIVEGFAEGTGCSFLNKIVVLYGEKQQVIADIVLPQGTYYSRETAMESIKDELCKYFFQACLKEQLDFSKEDVEKQVTELLDNCYFSESRKAVLDWATEVGIIKA